MSNTTITARLRVCAALLVLGSSHVAFASPAASGADYGECSSPALAFLAGSSLHVSDILDTTSIGSDRISLEPYAPPPEDAFVEYEGHPHWGRIAIAVIISADEDVPEYLPTRSSSTWALRDYTVIYITKAAAPGSELADYLFHSEQGLSAGYHLLHAEVEQNDAGDDDAEPTYHYTVTDIDQPIPNNFERGVVPTGLNL